MLRGGGWINPAENLRAAYRNRNHARNRNDDIGFRVAAAPANTLTARHRAGAGQASARGAESSRSARSRRAPGARASGWAAFASEP